MKKLLVSLLCAALCLALLPVMAEEAETLVTGDFEYILLEDGTAQTKKYTGMAETLDIPAELDGHAVTSIGMSAFANCSALTSLTIPASVTEIGRRAFADCDNLTVTVVGGSYAEQYCQENEVNYVLADG